LGQEKTPWRGGTEQGCVQGKKVPEPAPDLFARERKKSAAHPVPQEREADDHVGEVVPLDDREQAQQQDFVTDCGGRN